MRNVRPLLVAPGLIPESVKSAMSDPALMRKAQEYGQTAEPKPYEVHGGVGVVPIVGMMAKDSWVEFFGGTSTEWARMKVEQASDDPDVGAILLRVDSGGGEVGGTDELAEAVYRARGKKPVHAHIEDVGASAALWVASQASSVTANPTAMVGSYGVIAMLPDTAEAWKQIGVTWHVVSTGDYKGLISPETGITEKAVDYLREMIEPAFHAFGAALQRGRGLSDGQLKAISDGKVYGAEEAQRRGLIDGVSMRVDAVAGLMGRAQEALGVARGKVRDRTMKRALDVAGRRRAVLAALAAARRSAGG